MRSTLSGVGCATNRRPPRLRGRQQALDEECTTSNPRSPNRIPDGHRRDAVAASQSRRLRRRRARRRRPALRREAPPSSRGIHRRRPSYPAGEGWISARSIGMPSTRAPSTPEPTVCPSAQPVRVGRGSAAATRRANRRSRRSCCHRSPPGRARRVPRPTRPRRGASAELRPHDSIALRWRSDAAVVLSGSRPRRCPRPPTNPRRRTIRRRIRRSECRGTRPGSSLK